MNRQALSRTALWWIILVLILLAIALYFSYRERARFSPDESSSVAAAIKNPTECPSSPRPGSSCDSDKKKIKIVCLKNNAYCRCENGYWQNYVCPVGRPCKNNVGCTPAAS